MTAFHVAGLAIIVAAWAWIALAMRVTWPAVREFLGACLCRFNRHRWDWWRPELRTRGIVCLRCGTVVPYPRPPHLKEGA